MTFEEKVEKRRKEIDWDDDSICISAVEAMQLINLASRKKGALYTVVWDKNDEDNVIGAWRDAEVYLDLSEDGTDWMIEITPPSLPNVESKEEEGFMGDGPFGVATINIVVNGNSIEQHTVDDVTTQIFMRYANGNLAVQFLIAI